MTCAELRDHFEGVLDVESNARGDSGEIAQHVVNCAACSQFVEAQQELGRGLRLMQEGVPSVSAELDAAVLANYRQHVCELTRDSSRPRLRPGGFVKWSAALAAVILIGTILFFTRGKTATRPVSAPVHVAAVPRQPSTSVAIKQPAEPEPRRRETVSHAAFPALGKAARPGAFHKSNELPVGNPTTPVPAEFSSLMYCDELSCGGQMEVIRVKLPSSTLAMPGAPEQTNEAVVADVLVGSDGIARGIRIVQ